MKHIGKVTMAAVVAASTLSVTTAQAATTTTKYAVVDKTTSLNVRASASTKAKVIDKYKNNEKIQITNASYANWTQVLYKGKIGYVSSKYIDGHHDYN